MQTKLDLVKKNDTTSDSKSKSAMKSYNEIKTFIKDTKIENAKIIPVSTQYNANLDILCRAITELDSPIRDTNSPLLMNVVRSFDVNKPGINFINVIGGVVGGTIVQETLKLNDLVEIRPGIIKKEGEKIRCVPIITRVISLFREKNKLSYAIAGGLIAN